jgi:hypothetical protein
MTVTRTQEAPRQEAIQRAMPLWLRFVLPSIHDVLFAAIFLSFTLGRWAAGLLWDSSTGWHIRNGEQMLRTISVPRTDSFSYTMAGQPWFAWEWLWDTANGALHTYWGLSGVVAFSALVLALTFALLYRTTARRCCNSLIALTFTVLAFGASSLHILARPHMVSWLLVLLVVRELEALGRGVRRTVWTLPALFAAWANVHGSFVIGLALIGIYLVAALLELDRFTARKYMITLGSSALATIVNPYGLKLHAHVLRYFASHAQIDHIDEFLSPNFHEFAPRLFLVLVLIALATVFAARKIRWRDLLLAIFAICTALLAVRNIPASSMLLVFAIAPYVADWLRGARFRRIIAAGDRMFGTEQKLKPGLISLLAVLSICIAFATGLRLRHANWTPDHVPAKAADYLVNNLGARDHVFALDGWGGFLIYSYGGQGFRVAVDDRSDFYGNQRFEQYREIAAAGSNWRRVMDDWQIRYVLIPADSPLRSVLAIAPAWQEAYKDKVASVFVRTSEEDASRARVGSGTAATTSGGER